MRFLVAGAIVLAAAGFARAADWDIPPAAIAHNGCDQSSEVQAFDCTELAYEKADAELNQVWKKVLAKIAGGDAGQQNPQQWKNDLVAAEEAWVAFRDKEA